MRIEMVDGFEMAGCARLGRKHPASHVPAELLPVGEPALQDRSELAGDRESQRFAALGVVEADGHRGHVDLRPGERVHLGEAHAGVEAEAEGVAGHRVEADGCGRRRCPGQAGEELAPEERRQGLAAV